MQYKEFQIKTLILIRKAGGDIGVRFFRSNGRFFALCEDGTTLITNLECTRIEVQWSGKQGSHRAIALL